MLANILNLEGVQTLERKVLTQVNGGERSCACGGSGTGGNESGGLEYELCQKC